MTTASDVALPAERRLESLQKLRVPFPPEMIGKLPRVTCKDCSDRSKNCTKHSKTRCQVCSAYISTSHIHLDFVGHAELTDRLLSVDPEWNWEPLAFDARGLPAIVPSTQDDKMPGLRMWIRLTICGVTRLGCGSVEGGTFDIEKQLIGDALRNAAMRFGVALDLWAKSDLATMHAENSDDSEPSRPATTKRQPPARKNAPASQSDSPQNPPSRASDRDKPFNPENYDDVSGALEPTEAQAMAEYSQFHADQNALNDIATMPPRALSEALEALGLEKGGTVPEMRLRLQEARSGVSPAKLANQADDSAPDLASEKQVGFVNSFFKGYEDGERLAAISEIIGRDLESTKDLSKKEASLVIETMKSDSDNG